MATLTIPSVIALETGTGGYASGTITFPAGFTPAPLPSVDNPVWGITNLSINNDITYRPGVINIQNGILYIGIFMMSGTTTNNIGLTNSITLPYICS